MGKLFRELARIIVGAVFVFSGLMKGFDPLGTTYKFVDYLNAFGSSWATKLAFGFAIFLITAEFVIGITLLFNIKTKLFIWPAFAFMSVFLPLTLYIAIKNPVSDCGCFGDALVISNWATFYKNIVLLLLVLFVLKQKERYNPYFNLRTNSTIAFGSFVLFVFIITYSYRHLPLIDFRPYKVGVNIPEAMHIPEDAPETIYENEFIYQNKNTGENKKFTEDDYPWEDTLNWRYVEINSILIEKGYEPPIHDFTIENAYGENVSDYYLSTPGYTYMLVAYDLEKSNLKNQDEINDFANRVIENGGDFICLTSSTEDQIASFKNDRDAAYDFYFCDPIVLKTIIRSNPGLVVLLEGNIVQKYHWRDIPNYQDWLDEIDQL